MVASPTIASRKHSNGRQSHEAPGQQRPGKASSAPPSRDGHAQRAAQDVAGLKDYQLGDCVGKGAFGSVYRALNWGTGETVAIKQIRLADLPKSELKTIMLEIDLLKNLNHPNIVKYHGFVKSTESLYIILEFCENGSLHSICKNFGRFPENLVALYMSQVLHGLLYLHEQGVIHRDIKGANILTTKEGLVKLADFGVATKASGLDEASVVGTPYWMAPEVIELSGATTASDIWSLGCTVIELIEGKPPYHKLQPMQALFRIVNDEHPPLPQSASPIVRDFLMQCFQKNPNLRINAQRLLKHPWILSAKRANSVVQAKPTKYDEAVKSVQEWNEALRSPDHGSLRRSSRQFQSSLGSANREQSQRTKAALPLKSSLQIAKIRPSTELFRSPDVDASDNWDDDFDSAISPSALRLPQLKPKDHFAGQLSAERLKSFATFEPLNEEPSTIDSIDPFGDGEATVKSPLPFGQFHSLDKTVRSTQSIPAKSHSQKQRRSSNTSVRRHEEEPKTAFLRGIPKASQFPKTKIAALARPNNLFRESSVEDYSDLVAPDDWAFQKKLEDMQKHAEESFSPKLFHPSDLKSNPRSAQRGKSGEHPRQRATSSEDASQPPLRRTQSEVEIQKYAEDKQDEDFSDIFGKDGPRLSRADSDSGSDHSALAFSKMSTSWLGHDEDEADPFAHLEDGLDGMDLENNVARDRDARLQKLTEELVGALKVSQSDDILLDITDQLIQVLIESPDKKSVILKSHGMLPILEILKECTRRDIIIRLLRVVNMIILEDSEAQESLCFLGGIPIISAFAHKKFPSEIRKEAAAFVRQMYQTSTLTLQMFIGCNGLTVLSEFLEEDIDTERDLVLIGVNGVWSVFELQGPTPKNDFCRIFSRSSVLYPLSLVLNRVVEEKKDELSELIEGRIVNIFLIFSQAENHVKEIVADRMVLMRVLKDLRKMTPIHQITMLKFVKNLSMLATTHEALQNSNAIDILTDLLKSSKNLPHFREISNQTLNIMYNLCRLSKTRQEEAALNDVIPVLKEIIQTEWPLKEFALPILCDMAHSGKVCRRKLWENKGIQFYISLLADKYWQVTALDAIFIWLQEETARVERALLDDDCSFSKAVVNCFASTDISADAFENFLEPLQKLLRLSPPVAASLAVPEIFSRTVVKLSNRKPVVRLNLLRIIRSICDAAEEQGSLLRVYGLYESVQHLAEGDPAILVREMAEQLIKSCNTTHRSLRIRPASRGRPSISSITPPSLIHSQSMPTSITTSITTTPTPTPKYTRSNSSTSLLDAAVGASLESTSVTQPTRQIPQSRTPSIRPASRDENSASAWSGSSGSTSIGSGSSGSVSAKSRLPRTKLGRLSLAKPREAQENITPSGTPPPQKLVVKRRRQTSAAEIYSSSQD